MGLFNKLFGNKNLNKEKIIIQPNDNFDEFYCDTKSIEKWHQCKIETITKDSSITIVTTPETANTPLIIFADKIEEWKKIRKDNGINSDKLEEIFTDLIKYDILQRGMLTKFEEMKEINIPLGPYELITTSLLYNSHLASDYSIVIEFMSHPFDFKKHFDDNIKPILNLSGLGNINLSYTTEQINSTEYKYHISIGNEKTVKKLEIETGTDLLNPIYYLINQLLIEHNSSKRFFDLEMSSKILLDTESYMYLKNKYNLPLNK